jgi:endonuclease IV
MRALAHVRATLIFVTRMPKKAVSTVTSLPQTLEPPAFQEDEEIGTAVEEPQKGKGKKAKQKKLTPAEARLAADGRVPHPYAARTHLVGYHCSAAGGVKNAVLHARAANARAFALFVRPRGSWDVKPLSDEDCVDFKEAADKYGYSGKHILPHCSYLINVASLNEQTRKKSLEALIDEAERCYRLNIECTNFHPGSASGSAGGEEEEEGGEEGEGGEAEEADVAASSASSSSSAGAVAASAGNAAVGASASNGSAKAVAISNVSAAINEVHKKVPSVTLVIECMAGGGSVIGRRFEEIKEMIDGVEDKSRVGVCLDTAHLHGAGYDLRTQEGYEKVMAEFDRVIGLGYLRGMHLNDSQAVLGSEKDRHWHIGKGAVGLDCFRAIMRDKRTAGIPLILETPVSNTPPEHRHLHPSAYLPASLATTAERSVSASSSASSTSSASSATAAADASPPAPTYTKAETSAHFVLSKYKAEIDLLYTLDGEGEEEEEAASSSSSNGPLASVAAEAGEEAVLTGSLGPEGGRNELTEADLKEMPLPMTKTAAGTMEGEEEESVALASTTNYTSAATFEEALSKVPFEQSKQMLRHLPVPAALVTSKAVTKQKADERKKAKAAASSAKKGGKKKGASQQEEDAAGGEGEPEGGDEEKKSATPKVKRQRTA